MWLDFMTLEGAAWDCIEIIASGCFNISKHEEDDESTMIFHVKNMHMHTVGVRQRGTRKHPDSLQRL